MCVVLIHRDFSLQSRWESDAQLAALSTGTCGKCWPMKSQKPSPEISVKTTWARGCADRLRTNSEVKWRWRSCSLHPNALKMAERRKKHFHWGGIYSFLTFRWIKMYVHKYFLYIIQHIDMSWEWCNFPLPKGSRTQRLQLAVVFIIPVLYNLPEPQSRRSTVLHPHRESNI